MINVNQITSQLAKMPDQALQQYAMMHKNDPYTVSLALSESNRRKQMRDAAQGQQGMAPQPKVVDQGIAGMMAPAPQPQMPPPQAQAQPMPEDVGIGALPAPNMQGMAGGGIVAFGDGGEVQRFQSGGSAFERWLRSNITPVEQKRFESLQEQAEANRVVPAPESLSEQTARNRQLVADQGFTRGDVRFPAGLTSDTPPVPKVEIPPVVGAPGAGTGAPRAPAPAAPAGLSYLDRLKAAQTAMGPTVNPEQVAMDALVRERNKGATDAKTELQADIAARANQFQGREERTNKRQTELDKSKDANTGMALLEAGLAMMQSRGPGLAGIAQGAGVGLKQYQSGIKDLKAAQEKLDEARDRTDELKQNQSMMDKSAVRAANKDIRDASLAGQQYQIDARMKIYGENRTDARAGIANDIAIQQSALDRQSRERVANMPSGIERMARDLGKGNLEVGLKRYSELMGTDSKGMSSLITAYAKDPTALKLLESTDPALAALVKQQMQGMLLQPSNAPTGKAFP